MITPFVNQKKPAGSPGFTLVEMVTVIAILVTLMTAAVSMMSGTGVQSRKAGIDLLSGMIEQARTTAITSRTHVVLAMAEPTDLKLNDPKDGRCRIGLFKVQNWPGTPTAATAVTGTQIGRWQTLNMGLVMLDGQVDGLPNPIDEPEIEINYGTGVKAVKLRSHCLVFGPRGGLFFPTGSTPVAVRLAEGNYRGGKAAANKRAGQTTPTENVLKIGRVTARPYRFDG